MPDWEAELSALLHALDVRLEGEPYLAEQSMGGGADRHGLGSDPEDGGDLYDLGIAPVDLPGEHAPGEGDEVSAVRHEIEATLARVVRLSRTGQLDPALRDDVVFVLQALTRPQQSVPATEPEHDEWHLASAAAVLHFCRVVHRLTAPLESEAEP
jgi:hypothetical protein